MRPGNFAQRRAKTNVAMAQKIWTEPALNDLDAIADYIALDKPEAASRLVHRVFAHIEKLSRHPQLGPRIPELLPASRYRQIIEPPCRVFYRHDQMANKIFVLGVMRSERLFQPGILHGRDESGPF
jgi:plasmid stabilization system protein ParE